MRRKGKEGRDKRPFGVLFTEADRKRPHGQEQNVPWNRATHETLLSTQRL